MTATEDRRRWAALARQLAAATWPTADLGAGCGHLSAALLLVLGANGVRAYVQGGTALWRRLPRELDDGVAPTHFGYEFDVDSPATRARLAADLLPEMHVWIVIPDREEIVDLTTGDQVRRCREVIGLDWPAPHPPADAWWPYGGDPGHDPPAEGHYRATPQGTAIARVVVHRLGREIGERVQLHRWALIR